MSDNWCNTCGKYMLFPESHHCPPLWEVFIEDYNGKPGDKNECPYEIYASDAQDAAEQGVEKSDSESCDYTCVRGAEVTVHVRDRDGAITHWVVTGESVPKYSAYPMPIKENTNGGLRHTEKKSSDLAGQPPAH